VPVPVAERRYLLPFRHQQMPLLQHPGVPDVLGTLNRNKPPGRRVAYGLGMRTSTQPSYYSWWSSLWSGDGSIGGSWLHSSDRRDSSRLAGLPLGKTVEADMVGLAQAAGQQRVSHHPTVAADRCHSHISRGASRSAGFASVVASMPRIVGRTHD